jgi:hypothetical protein
VTAARARHGTTCAVLLLIPETHRPRGLREPY